jgi:Arabinose efflux permease
MHLYNLQVPEKQRIRLSSQVIFLGLAALLNDVSSEIIYPLLPIFLTSVLGGTAFIVGMIEGSAEAVSAFLKLAAGAWSDRLPTRKPMIVGGYLLAAVSRGALTIAGHWPTVLGARLVDRVGKGIRSAPRDAMITDVTPVEIRGRAFGFHRAMDHTGAVIGPLIAFACLSWLGVPLRALFLIATVPALVGVVVLLFLLKESPREIRPRGEAHESREPLTPRFWSAIGAIALFYLANSTDAFLILQAHAAGVTTAMLPLLWAAHHVLKSLLSTHGGGLSDRISRPVMLFVGWMMYAAIYFAFPFAKSLVWFFVLFILYALPFTLTEGTERAWISDLVPAESRGRSFGIYYLTVGVFTLGGSVLFGLLWEKVSQRAAFHTGAVIAIVAAISVVVQKQKTRRAT